LRELPQVKRGTSHSWSVHKFIEEALRERASFSVRSFGVDAARAPSGVFTGSFAIHPATGEPVPIYVADYVLATYGTGAVMRVPAHDGRDFRFAQANGLPVVRVISPAGVKSTPTGDPWTADGVLIDSDGFTGMPSKLARDAIAE
jgi:leucyl-tRNA synthetase